MPAYVDTYGPSVVTLLATAVAVVYIRRARRRHLPRPVKQRDASGARGSMAGSVVRWLVVAVVLAGATGAGLYWLLGRPRLPSAASFSTAELLDLLKIGLAVVGGLGAVVALAVAYRRQQVSEAAHLIATWQEDRDDTKFLNERYGKAAEQLGHDSFAVRLAGVYAMGALADDWAAQRQTCVDVLCGYLRTPYPDGDPTEREVRQAILTTLLDRSSRSEWRGVDMDFRGADLEDLDLSERTLHGDFSFDFARFRGTVTDFSEAVFRGGATFRGATFEAERTSFWGASGRRATLDFSAATFSGEVVDFSRSDLGDEATLWFEGAESTGCVFRHDDGEHAGVEEFAEALRGRKDAGSPKAPGVDHG
ncbi:MAG: pentapeptide repeat-containing protein [Saccharothrix sp.]|nr:pentapeptide repeat-containing protein [Saccharothrix sp.]